MDTAAAWTEWLSSPDSRPALTDAARFIYRQALRLALPAELRPCSNPWELPPNQRADCFEMLADDLWIFLRSRSANWFLKNQWTLLAARGQRFLMLKIGQEFLGHLRDKARTSSHDPARALHRHLRQVLQEAGEITCRAIEVGSFYSLDPQAEPCDSLQSLEAEPYTQWDSPLDLVGLKDLEKKSSLLTLARFFWEEASRRLNKACFLPVRELVRFILAHYSVPLPSATIPLTSGEGDSREGHAMNIDDLREDYCGEASFVARQLETLARQLAASWTAKQRAVFSLIVTSELYQRRLRKYGVVMLSITQETSDDPTGQMIRRFFGMIDEYQSQENAKHTLRAMKGNARQGIPQWFKAAFWVQGRRGGGPGKQGKEEETGN